MGGKEGYGGRERWHNVMKREEGCGGRKEGDENSCRPPLIKCSFAYQLFG